MKFSLLAVLSLTCTAVYAAAIPQTDDAVSTGITIDLGEYTDIEKRGALKKKVDAFIDLIPDDKLHGFPSSAGTIWKNDDFRLDMQGMINPANNAKSKGKTTKTKGKGKDTGATTTEPRKYNLQIQANKGSKEKDVAKAAPATVAGPVKIDEGATVTPASVRKMFHSANIA